MSQQPQHLHIAPPLLSPGGNMSERFYSYDHRCPYCGGNGYHLSEDSHGSSYRRTCPICYGEGCLTAHITIEWKVPNK